MGKINSKVNLNKYGEQLKRKNPMFHPSLQWSNSTLPPRTIAYLLLFNTFIDLGRGFFVGPKQTDHTGTLRVQNIPILIPNHLVQLQDPVMGNMRGEDWGGLQQGKQKKREDRGRIMSRGGNGEGKETEG